ncbi:MAG: periplasmic heavy metal sensor [FCB group bacterium]|nr:periplasmic heavy metal sensor [FCB group bacterium]
MYEKNKFLLWAIVALIILNMGSLGLLWYKEVIKPTKPALPAERQGNPNKFLEMELQLTEDQVEAFRELRQQHERETQEIRRDIHRLSKDIVDELFRPQSDTALVTILSDEIGRKQAEFERVLYSHFDGLKQVCRPDQQEKLRGLLFEMLERTKRDSPPPRQGDRPNRKPPPRRGDNSDRPPPPRPDDDRGEQPPPRPEENSNQKPPSGG